MASTSKLIWMQSNLSTAALLAGEVDTAFGTPQSLFAVLAAKNPPPLTTIGAWGSASEHWLVVNAAIKTGKDLEGKIIGVSRPRSADHGYTTVILERMGIDPRKITFLIHRRSGTTRCSRGGGNHDGQLVQPLLHSPA